MVYFLSLVASEEEPSLHYSSVFLLEQSNKKPFQHLGVSPLFMLFCGTHSEYIHIKRYIFNVQFSHMMNSYVQFLLHVYMHQETLTDIVFLQYFPKMIMNQSVVIQMAVPCILTFVSSDFPNPGKIFQAKIFPCPIAWIYSWMYSWYQTTTPHRRSGVAAVETAVTAIHPAP